MTMSDPVADMLSRIRNGYLAGKKKVSVPHSRIKKEIAEVLLENKFLKKVQVQGSKAAEKELILTLLYQQGKPSVEGIRKVTKPGLRVYVRTDKIPSIRWGYGVTIISTSKGLMTGKNAKKKNLGGEVICQVW